MNVWILAKFLSEDIALWGVSAFMNGSSHGVRVAGTFERGYLFLILFLVSLLTLRVHEANSSFFVFLDTYERPRVLLLVRVEEPDICRVIYFL